MSNSTPDPAANWETSRQSVKWMEANGWVLTFVESTGVSVWQNGTGAWIGQAAAHDLYAHHQSEMIALCRQAYSDGEKVGIETGKLIAGAEKQNNIASSDVERQRIQEGTIND